MVTYDGPNEEIHRINFASKLPVTNILVTCPPGQDYKYCITPTLLRKKSNYSKKVQL